MNEKCNSFLLLVFAKKMISVIRIGGLFDDLLIDFVHYFTQYFFHIVFDKILKGLIKVDMKKEEIMEGGDCK